MSGNASDSHGEVRPARARDWEEFYTELIDFEERILFSMRELSTGMTERERAAVKRTDLEPLEDLIDDFRRRLDLWRARIASEQRGG